MSQPKRRATSLIAHRIKRIPIRYLKLGLAILFGLLLYAIPSIVPFIDGLFHNGTMSVEGKPVVYGDTDNITVSLNSWDLEKVVMVRVIDGDTIVVRRLGEEKTIRLIGIDTPETTRGKDEPYGQEATEYVRSLLGEGDGLWLEYDVSKTDPHDRELCYVWLEAPTDKESIDSNLRRRSLNATLVSEGYAFATPWPPDVKYRTQLACMQGEAHRAGVGLWSLPAAQIKALQTAHSRNEEN